MYEINNRFKQNIKFERGKNFKPIDWFGFCFLIVDENGKVNQLYASKFTGYDILFSSYARCSENWYLVKKIRDIVGQ